MTNTASPAEITLFNTLASPTDLNRYTIEGWANDRDNYAEKPLGIHLKVLEAAQAGGLAGRLYEILQNPDQAHYTRVSPEGLISEFLGAEFDGQNRRVWNEQVGWEGYREKLREYEQLRAIFADEAEDAEAENAKPAGQITYNSAESAGAQLWESYGAERGTEYHSFIDNGVVFYVKTTLPDTYEKDYRIEVRTPGPENTMQSVEIRPRLSKLDQGAGQAHKYEIAEELKLRLPNPDSTRNGDAWYQGDDVESVLRDYEKGITDAQGRYERRLKRPNQAGRWDAGVAAARLKKAREVLDTYSKALSA